MPCLVAAAALAYTHFGPGRTPNPVAEPNWSWGAVHRGVERAKITLHRPEQEHALLTDRYGTFKFSCGSAAPLQTRIEIEAANYGDLSRELTLDPFLASLGDFALERRP